MESLRDNISQTAVYGTVLDCSVGLREAQPILLSPIQTIQLKDAIKHVEYYQPLYGIRIAPRPLRPCRDRAEVIARAVGTIGADCRIVDFGCSLGYFVFYFSDRGAQAEGLDYSPHNIRVAQTVAGINGLNCSFTQTELTLEYARQIPSGQYNVGLLLSVLHHITHEHGMEYVCELISELTRRIPALVLELAHRDEPVDFAWRESLPADPLEILAKCTGIQVRKLGEFDSHLSSALRPMYWVSSR